MSKEKTKRITSIGGQALIEGILMRGPEKTSLAVRKPDGSIYNEYMSISQIKDKSKLFKLPIFRGISSFIDSMIIGYKALMISAEVSAQENETEELSKVEKWIDDKFGDKIMGIIMTIASILGIAFSVLLFLVFPTWIFNLISGHVSALHSTVVYRSIFEGILRIIIFLVYVMLCSQLKDMKRVFQYHGAEHKTIFCYECEEELTVDNVKTHTRFHPRCGTSFMFLMILVGIIVGFFIPFSNPFLRSFIKILCIPIIVGLGYELIKVCGKYDNIITRIISAPGLWIQRITTKEPDDDMIEIAITAMKAVIPENGDDIIGS